MEKYTQNNAKCLRAMCMNYDYVKIRLIRIRASTATCTEWPSYREAIYVYSSVIMSKYNSKMPIFPQACCKHYYGFLQCGGGWGTAVPRSFSPLPTPTPHSQHARAGDSCWSSFWWHSCSPLWSEPKLAQVLVQGQQSFGLHRPPEIPSMGPTPRISPGLLVTDFSVALYCYWTRVLVGRFSCVISYLPSSRKWQRLCFARPHVSLSTQHRWLRLCWLSNSTGMWSHQVKYSQK